MRIRSKVILVVLPLIVTPLVLLGIASFYAARNGITGVATEFLAFKAEQLASYADSQWTVLEQNGLSNRPEFVDLAKAAVASFARSMVRSPTEVILALEADGTPAFLTSDATPTADEAAVLAALAREPTGGWRELTLAGDGAGGPDGQERVVRVDHRGDGVARDVLPGHGADLSAGRGDPRRSRAPGRRLPARSSRDSSPGRCASW